MFKLSRECEKNVKQYFLFFFGFFFWITFTSIENENGKLRSQVHKAMERS